MLISYQLSIISYQLSIKIYKCSGSETLPGCNKPKYLQDESLLLDVI